MKLPESAPNARRVGQHKLRDELWDFGAHSAAGCGAVNAKRMLKADSANVYRDALHLREGAGDVPRPHLPPGFPARMYVVGRDHYNPPAPRIRKDRAVSDL
jgi:hypothetical protein